MKNPSIEEVERWLRRPLCRKYLLVHFSMQFVKPDTKGSARSLPVIWAFGILDRGAMEVLGCWEGAGQSASDWEAVFTDLIERGVQQIRFVSNVHGPMVQKMFPGAEIPEHRKQALSGAPPAVSRHLASALRSLNVIVDDMATMQNALERASYGSRSLGGNLSPATAAGATLRLLTQRADRRMALRAKTALNSLIRGAPRSAPTSSGAGS